MGWRGQGGRALGAPGQLRHKNERPGHSFSEQRVGFPRPVRPLWAAVSGSRSRDWRASPGEKGRAAREWIPAGHGCSGRRPSSLLASSVWLAPGSRLGGGPVQARPRASQRQHLMTLERVGSRTWTRTRSSGQVETQDVACSAVAPSCRCSMVGCKWQTTMSSRSGTSCLPSTLRRVMLAAPCLGILWRHMMKGIRHTPGRYSDVGSLGDHLANV